MEHGRVSPLYWAVAYLVRGEMGKRNLSRDDMAPILGISPSSVRRYFLDVERAPDLDTLSRVAEMLGMRLSEFIEHAERHSADVTQGNVDEWLSLDKDERKFWRIPASARQYGSTGFGVVLDRPQQGLAEEYERRAGTPDEGEPDAQISSDDRTSLG